MTEPRGIRNHNPGNIEYSPATKWQGLADPPTDGRFCRFKAPAWGIRALARVLITYQDKHGLNTVRKIVTRWAPPVENNTTAYVNAVARRVGVGPDMPISVHDYETLAPLAEAIIHHENGKQPYDKATIEEGLYLAGVVKPSRPLAKDRGVQGGVASAGTGAALTATEAAQVVEALESGRSFFSDPGNIFMLVIGVGLIGFGIWKVVQTIRERKRLGE